MMFWWTTVCCMYAYFKSKFEELGDLPLASIHYMLLVLPVALLLWYCLRSIRTWMLVKSGSVRKRAFLAYNDDCWLAFVRGVNWMEASLEQACNNFVMAAEQDNADAFAVLAWLAATGRTKRYDALQTAWLIREAKARGSKLLEPKADVVETARSI